MRNVAAPPLVANSGGTMTSRVSAPPARSSSALIIAYSREGRIELVAVLGIEDADRHRPEGDVLHHEVVLRHVEAPVLELDAVEDHLRRIGGNGRVGKSDRDLERRLRIDRRLVGARRTAAQQQLD